MKIYKAKDYKDMSRKAANIISAQVIVQHAHGNVKAWLFLWMVCIYQATTTGSYLTQKRPRAC